MTRSSQIALCVALMLTVTSAATTNTLSSTAFAAAPGKVFDGATGGVDVATWGTYEGAYFGPGTANTTVYAYGIDLSTGASINKVTSRTLNATLLSNGTADTTIYAKVGDDQTYSTTITITADPIAAVGLGSIALAYVATDTATIPCSQVYVAVFNGGTAAPIVTKSVTGYTCTACTTATAATTGVGYVNTVTGLFYENSTYYVTYTSTKYTETSDGTTACTATSPVASTATIGKGQVYAYIQGVAASSSGDLKWSTVPAVYTGTLSSAGAEPSPTAATVKPKCGPGNYTNSTTFYCTYSNGATANVQSYVPVTVSSGTAGTAVTLSTDVAADTSTAGNTYTTAGFVYSLYQQGILINNKVQSSTTSPITYTNTLQLYNLTSGATATAGGVAFATSITNSYENGQYGGSGIIYSSGFGIIDTYASASGSYVWEIGAWLANGTTNGSKTTYATGTGAGQSNWFVDANGALWAGSYSLDTTVTTGYLGKLVSQVYAAGSFGNILASFFALLSLVMAALLAF